MKTIFNHIGKTLLLAGLSVSAVGGMFSSCGDYLDIEPQNIIPLDKFWKKKSDVTQSLLGCYTTLAANAALSRMMVWGEFRSENILNRGTIQDDVNLERVLKESITANNGYASWSVFYEVINRCNLVLYYAPLVAAEDPSYDAGELEAHRAEAIALRSLCYFYLIRTFRDVPYLTEPVQKDSEVAAHPQTDFYVVLQNLINSLEEVEKNAVVYYPVTEPEFQTCRMTQLGIYSMLCEMYLWNKQYDKCIEYADKVIAFKKEYVEKQNTVKVDYSDYYGYPLQKTRWSASASTSFGAAFTDLFINNLSLESIFELGYYKENPLLPCNVPVNSFYGNLEFTGQVKPSEYLVSQAKSSSSTLYLSNKFDGRRYENFRFNSSGEATQINKYTVSYSSELFLPSPTTSNFYSYSSYWGIQYEHEMKGKDRISHNKSNWIIYRLADIMLLKAEAEAWKLASMSQTTTAPAPNPSAKEPSEEEPVNKEWEATRLDIFRLCNAVYKRSLYETDLKDTLKYDDYTTQEALLNLVYDERQRELMFEGKRYYDLVRRSMIEGNTSYLRSKASQRSTELAGTIDNFMNRMEAIFWPVFLDEIKVSNGVLKQNPAFGSGESSSVKQN